MRDVPLRRRAALRQALEVRRRAREHPELRHSRKEQFPTGSTCETWGLIYQNSSRLDCKSWDDEKSESFARVGYELCAA